MTAKVDWVNAVKHWLRLANFLTFLAFFFIIPLALANQPVEVDLNELGSGELLFLTDQPGVFVPAPRLSTEVEAKISGIVTRVTVRQVFKNVTHNWVEAVYVFPLPEDSAVDSLKMIIGDRVIVGEVRPREEARAVYEEAKESGRQASLVEQERPNMFTTSVANIAPGQEVSIEIGYSEVLSYDDGRFSWRFPLAITPRYIPGTPKSTEPQGGGWAPDTDQVPDASRITPHYSSDALNPVNLHLELNAGFPLEKIESRYHTAQVYKKEDSYLIDLQTTAGKDFELVWRPKVNYAPAAAAFTQTINGKHYALILLMPPARESTREAPPRELIFIIDTSGSMNGTSIEQAKKALAWALEKLRPEDRFNIVEFNSEAHSLFSGPVPADRVAVLQAKRFVGGLKANGGTEIAKAIRLALNSPAPQGYLRQVVFITDGSVGNETELFRLLEERLQGANLFTVGIGSAPNSYFMRKAAEFGHGSYIYIGDVTEVGEKMSRLFTKLERPVLTDIKLVLPSGSEVYPQTVPNLYAGEPVVVSARVPTLNSIVAIRGHSGGEKWVRSLNLAAAPQGEIALIWARAKVESLKDAMIRGGDYEKLEKAITQVALEHHLITDYTSLVAVDKTPARPEDERLEATEVPLQVPEGQTVDPRMLKPSPAVRVGSLAFASGYPTTATPAPLRLLLGLAALLMAAAMLLWRRLAVAS